MACPFLEDPVDFGAQIVRGALRERDPTAVKMTDRGAAIYLIYAVSPKRKFLLRVMYCFFGVHNTSMAVLLSAIFTAGRYFCGAPT